MGDRTHVYKGQLLVGFALNVTDIAEPAPPEPATKDVNARLYAIGKSKGGAAKETLLVLEGYRLVEETLLVEEWTRKFNVSQVEAQNGDL